MQTKITLQSFMKRYSDDKTRLLALLYARVDGNNDCLNQHCGGKIDKDYRHLKWRIDDKVMNR